MTADATLLQMKYARIISLLAKQANIEEEKAMELFYNSNTYMLMSKDISDFHCLSDTYLVDEILNEGKEKQTSYNACRTVRKRELLSNMTFIF